MEALGYLLGFMTGWFVAELYHWHRLRMLKKQIEEIDRRL